MGKKKQHSSPYIVCIQLHATMALHVMSIAPQWWTSGSFPSIYIYLNQLRHFSKCSWLVSRKSCATCVLQNLANLPELGRNVIWARPQSNFFFFSLQITTSDVHSVWEMILDILDLVLLLICFLWMSWLAVDLIPICIECKVLRLRCAQGLKTWQTSVEDTLYTSLTFATSWNAIHTIGCY